MVKKIESIQHLDRFDFIATKELTLQNKLNDLLMREKLLWKEKSQAQWINEGDTNTRYFYLSTTIKRKFDVLEAILMDY